MQIYTTLWNCYHFMTDGKMRQSFSNYSLVDWDSDVKQTIATDKKQKLCLLPASFIQGKKELAS